MSRLSILLIVLVLGVLAFGGIGLGAAYFDTKTLQGTVVDANGAPIAKAALAVGERSTLSDAQGHFEIQFPRGAWDLYAFADGFQNNSQRIDAADWLTRDFSTTITLDAKAWRGQVVASDTNTPLANTNVQIGDNALTTDAQGNFVTKGVHNGEKIIVAHPGYDSVTVTVQNAGNSDKPIVITLVPSELRVTVLDAVTQKPLPGVRVESNGQRAMTDVTGLVVFKGLAQGSPLSAQAPGYAVANATLKSADPLTLQLQPTSLVGRVVDATTKTSVANALILAGNIGETLVPIAQTGADGIFTLDDFSSAPKLYIKKPGYLLGTFDLTHGGAQDLALTPFNTQGIHLYYGIQRQDAERVLNQLKDTQMNAVVFDVKEDPGYLLWDSQVPLAKQIGAYNTRSYTAQDEVASCKQYHLYCIARVTVMKDVLLATTRPDLALHNAGGGLLYENNAYWLNPNKPEVQAYHIALAHELAAMGFDEIQFDYIRFPGTTNVLASEFGGADFRVSTISNFLTRAGQALRPTTAFFSGDVFGLTTAVSDEQGIGQVWENVAPQFDYVSPMMYPSTWRYATGLWGLPFGIKNCADAYICPYDVIRYGTVKATERTTNNWTKVRPWIQAYGMNLQQMLAQSSGADDGAGYGYLFWNNQGVYPDGLFKKK